MAFSVLFLCDTFILVIESLVGHTDRHTHTHTHTHTRVPKIK